MNVLSLFDGLSGARLACDKANIKVDKYYASEVDKYAIQISQKNYPDNIQVGDVTKLSSASISEPIDLLIGGSPCQNLSILGNRQGLKGNKSSLFYEYVRLKEEIKPKYFLLENVASMRNEDRDTITEIMGVQPLKFNSKDVSAQSRTRYYWTNIPNVQPLPKANPYIL